MMACGRCGNNNRPNTVPSTVSGGRPGTSPRPGSPAVVRSGQPTVHPSIKDQISSLHYVPNDK